MQGRADEKGTPASFSWDAMSRMLQNITGQTVNYDIFKAEYDSDPGLADLVDQFDDRGITIKTHKKEQPVKRKSEKSSGVESSAKRAAAKVINR